MDIQVLKCPHDKADLDLKQLDKMGIFIYKCSHCGGIWIDRINIEKLFHSSKNTEVFLAYLAKILNIEISEI